MRRKWIKVLAAALCIVMAVPVIGSAAPLELETKCSLKVQFPEENADNKDMLDDLKKPDNDPVVYDLYKVADMVNDGGYYTYVFTTEFQRLRENTFLTEKYGNLIDAKNQLVVPRDGSEINSGLWDDLSQEAARLALDIPRKEAAGTGTDAEESNSEGTGIQAGSGLPVIGEIIGTNEPGANRFTPVLAGASLGVETPNPASLDAGLYLLIARGTSVEDNKYITKEYAVTNPDTQAGGTVPAPGKETKEEKIVTVAYTDQHVYTFAPQLISLPTKDPENGVVSTANSGNWDYSPTVYLKPEQHMRYGRLEIVKDLITYESFDGQSEEAVFVFQVEAVLNNQSVYSDVKTLYFASAGKKNVVVDKIPVGATVTVTEVYSGASYTLKAIEQGYYAEGAKPDCGDSVEYASVEDISRREVTGFNIEANRVASVKFTNDYDHRQTGGQGVINHYEYGENGWEKDAVQERTNPAQNNPPQGNENP